MQIRIGTPIFMQGKKVGGGVGYIKSCKDTVIKAINQITI